MTRLRPQKPILLSCSADAWQELLMAMNAKTENVTISRSVLVEVMECHERAMGKPCRLPILQIYRIKAIVDRAALFAFVQEHGAFCGKSAPLHGGLQAAPE
jgi:hypothetical protein